MALAGRSERNCAGSKCIEADRSLCVCNYPHTGFESALHFTNYTQILFGLIIQENQNVNLWIKQRWKTFF